MMQTTMLPFPYSLSCPPFLDISAADSVTSTSPSGTPSPPAVNYVSQYYENIFSLTPNSRQVLTNMPYAQHPFKPAMYGPDRVLSKQNSCGIRKKSFTIEAILGLNNYEEDSNDLCVKQKFDREIGPIRIADSRRQERLLSPSPYAVPSATPRSALTTEFSPVKESKLKSHHPVHAINETSPVDVDRLAIPTSKSPPCNNTASICGSTLGPKSSGGKAKRIRTIFTPEQLERLETEFERQQYMVGPERLYLASALNLTEAQVKVWFQNRRIKWRKQHLEMQQARLAQLREAETAESETEADPPALTEEISPNHWSDLLDDRN